MGNTNDKRTDTSRPTDFSASARALTGGSGKSCREVLYGASGTSTSRRTTP